MLRWGDIYKWAGVLGLSIGHMTLFEFRCAQDGWAEANGSKKRRGGSISEKRLAEMGIVGF
jgi:hypothetical protein